MPAADRQAPRALLLTAGLGTRLHPLTTVRAKAAVPINGEALVRRVIRGLATAGIRDLVLNLHHRPASIARLVGDGSDLGVRVRYSWEQPLLGSAGGPRHALPLVADRDDDDFLIVNGDTLTDVDIWSLVARHRESGALVTMALIPNPRPDHYGGVLVSPEGRITGFTRARQRGTGGDGPPTLHGFHFIGVQVAKARAFATLEDGVPAESVNALYPRLMAEQPGSVAAHISEASFLDIGTPRDCLETSLAIARVEGSRLTGAGARIADSAVLVRSMVWDDVTVGAHAQLHDCIVADGARIPDGARYERCAIVPAGDRTPVEGERLDGELLVRSFPEQALSERSI
jgi:NDP-sugar pyrophosphorylase family protein